MHFRPLFPYSVPVKPHIDPLFCPTSQKVSSNMREIVSIQAGQCGNQISWRFWDLVLREHVQHLLRRLGYPVELTRTWSGKDQPWVHPARAVALDRDGSPVGYVAHLHPAVAAALNLPKQVAIACVDIRALLANGRIEPSYTPVPTHPELPVDVALLVDVDTQAATVGGFLRETGRKLKVQNIDNFDPRGWDMALFAIGSEATAIHAPRFAAAGCTVIDNSSLYRMHARERFFLMTSRASSCANSIAA